MSTNLAAAASKKRVVGKLFIMPSALGHYKDLGNILKFKLDTETKTVQHKKADPLGFKTVDLEEVIETNWTYKITFDEEYPATRQLLLHTLTAATTATQNVATAPNGTITFVDVAIGGTYFLGVYNATTVVVAVAASTKTLGTDYTFDAITGALTILGAGISALDDVIVTWACPAETRDSYTTLDGVQCDGTFKLVEYDRHATGPRQITTFNGTCWVSSEGDNDGDKFSEFELSVRAFSKPTVLARQ